MTRRFLIACGTENYMNEQRLPSVPDDLNKVVALFTSLGYEPQLPGLRHDPAASDLREGLEDWFNDRDRRESDVLVFYYSGHGESTGSRHYLLTRDSQPRRPTTAFATDFFAELLGPEPLVRRVLLIIDTCYSGQAALDAQHASLRNAYSHGTSAQRDEGVWVVSASLPKEEADQYAFADALVTATSEACRTSGSTQRFVPLEYLVDRINEVFTAQRIPQTAGFVSAGIATGLPPFLPNPRYDPRARPNRDQEPTDHFTGRTSVLRLLTVATRTVVDAADGWQTSERGVGSMVVVCVEPAG